jgi:hypothetical protein
MPCLARSGAGKIDIPKRGPESQGTFMVAQAGKVPVSTSSFNRLVSIATAGAVCGLLAIVLAIGAGSLVFAVDQSAYLPLIVGVALLSAAILALVSVLGSTIRPGVPTVQEVPCVVLGVMTGVRRVGDAVRPVVVVEREVHVRVGKPEGLDQELTGPSVGTQARRGPDHFCAREGRADPGCDVAREHERPA